MTFRFVLYHLSVQLEKVSNWEGNCCALCDTFFSHISLKQDNQEGVKNVLGAVQGITNTLQMLQWNLTQTSLSTGLLMFHNNKKHPA